MSVASPWTARTRVASMLAACLLFGLAASAPDTARANGVPVPVALSYIDLSNWGPREASGTAELIFAEGIVRVQAQGLPSLQGKQYQGWLVNSQAGDAISVGRFAASAGGVVSYKGTLPPIADFGFDLFIMTVEPEPDDAPQPTTERSIGGYFSLTGERSPDGRNGDTSAAGQTLPGALPATGDATFLTDIMRAGLLAGAMGLSVLAGIRLGRKHS